jgi:hypothetical protein
MGSGDDELDQQDGQGADELEGPEVPEQDQQGGDELAAHDQHLGELIKRGEQAGYGAQTQTLRRVRKALRGVRTQVDAAEARGRARALEEFSASNGEAVDAIKQQVRQELAAETSRQRSLDRLGVPEPLRSMFDTIDPAAGFAAFQKQADLLRSAGVEWRQDPEAQQLAQARVRAWQDQAATAEQNGHVDVSPGPMPDQVREDLIRKGVEAMAGAQAGAQPVGADSLEDEIRRADPERLGQAGVEDLARRFNRELDGLAHYMGGGGPL